MPARRHSGGPDGASNSTGPRRAVHPARRRPPRPPVRGPLDILPALKGEDSSVGSFEPAPPFRDDGRPAVSRITSGRADGPRLSACGFVDAPSALRRVWRVGYPLGVARTTGRRCMAPTPVQGSWATGRAIGLSRPSKPHDRDQPGEDCFLSVAATASRRPRRRLPGNGMVASVVRAEPNPTASFCPCWVAYCPTPESISVGERSERVRRVSPP